MKKIGILFGQESSFPPAFVERVNLKTGGKDIQAEFVRIDKVIQGEPCGYDVVIDRISQDVPFYRAWLKNAALSGAFEISSFFDGYSDDNIYFNSPYDYMPNIDDPWKFNHMGIILGTGEWDNTRHESMRLSHILNSKGIQHFLDDRCWCGHDWNYWCDMLPYYLSLIGDGTSR